MDFTEEIGKVSGAVRKIEAETVSVFEKGERIESVCSFTFDESKNLIESFYSIPEKYSQKNVCKFNAKNLLIESEFYLNDVRQSRCEFEYDAHDKLFETRFFYGDDKLCETTRPIFTPENLRVEEKIYDPPHLDDTGIGGHIIFRILPEISTGFSLKNVARTESFYESGNRLVELLVYNRRKKLNGRIIVFYNAAKRPVKIEKYGGNTTVNKHSSSKFLQAAKKIGIRFWLGFNPARRKKIIQAKNSCFYGNTYEETLIEHDEAGRICKITCHSMPFNIISKRVFEYEKEGNPAKETLYRADDVFSLAETYEYKYDARNNWIERTVQYILPAGSMSRFMERNVLTRRKIEYF